MFVLALVFVLVVPVLVAVIVIDVDVVVSILFINHPNPVHYPLRGGEQLLANVGFRIRGS